MESRLARTFEPAAKLEAAAKKNTFQPAALAIKIYHAMLYLGIVDAPERQLRQRRKHATHGADEMRSASGSRLLRSLRLKRRYMYGAVLAANRFATVDLQRTRSSLTG